MCSYQTVSIGIAAYFAMRSGRNLDDVKRLAASVTVAARANGFDELHARTAKLACLRS